jgi:hypothetical protein
MFKQLDLGDSCSWDSFARGWREASSRVATRSQNYSPSGKYVDLDDDTKSLQSLGDFAVISAPPPEHRLQWDFVGWRPGALGREEPILYGRFSREAVLSWLSRRRAFVMEGRAAPQPVALVFAIERAEDMSCCKELFDATAYPSVTGDLKLDVLPACCWYWTGNWLQLLFSMQQLYGNGKVKVWGRYPPSANDAMCQVQDGTLPDRVGGLCLDYLSIPELPGYFVRALNSVAFEMVRSIEQSLVETGRICRLDETKRSKANEVVWNAMQVVVRIWDLL